MAFAERALGTGCTAVFFAVTLDRRLAFAGFEALAVSTGGAIASLDAADMLALDGAFRAGLVTGRSPAAFTLRDALGGKMSADVAMATSFGASVADILSSVIDAMGADTALLVGLARLVATVVLGVFTFRPLPVTGADACSAGTSAMVGSLVAGDTLAALAAAAFAAVPRCPRPSRCATSRRCSE